MSMQAGRHTCARAAALAIQTDPPSPTARPVPIHVMGRPARYRAHGLMGLASAERSLEDEK